MNLFRCKHPAARLHVLRDETVQKVDADFLRVTYHLRCSCGAEVPIKFSRLVGGVEGFLARGVAA